MVVSRYELLRQDFLSCLTGLRRAWRGLRLEYLIDKSAPISRLTFNPIWINCKLTLYSSREILIELRRKRSRTWLCHSWSKPKDSMTSIPSRFSPYTCANMKQDVAWELRRQCYDVIFELCQMEFRQKVAKKTLSQRECNIFKYLNEASLRAKNTKESWTDVRIQCQWHFVCGLIRVLIDLIE